MRVGRLRKLAASSSYLLRAGAALAVTVSRPGGRRESRSTGWSPSASALILWGEHLIGRAQGCAENPLLPGVF